MRVVLVWPPIRLPRVFAHYPTFSAIGLLTSAAYLRGIGLDVQVVDALTMTGRLNMRPDGGTFRHIGAETSDVAREVSRIVAEADGNAVVLVAATMFSEMNRVHETLVPATAAAIRALLPGTPIGIADFHVGGMNYFPYEPRRALEASPGVDFIIVGEGEPTIPAVVGRLQEGRSLVGLPRVAVREVSGISYDPTEPQTFTDIDAMPPPAFDMLDMEAWFAVQADAIRSELVHEYHVVERQLPLLTSRSCPFRCHFCTNQVMALPWRAHSVDWLKRVILDLRDRYRVDRFMFLDDNINVDGRRFRELVQWLAEQRIPWDAVNGYRADLLDLEAVRAIKAAGNTKITVSAESGDPEILTGLIQKKLKLSKVIEVSRICEEERIPLQIHYIVGVPGETKKQMNKTLEFATMLYEQHSAWPLLQHAIPFPGTQLFRDCEKNDWFIAPPFEIPGEVLEQQSVIRTPDFEPGEVMRMKWNAQKLHESIRALAWLEVDEGGDDACLACCTRRTERPDRAAISRALEHARFRGGRELFLGGADPTTRKDLEEIIREARTLGFQRVTLVGHGLGLADPARAVRIFAERVDAVLFDLHGPDATTHDAVSGVPGSFVSVLAAARAVVGASVQLELRVAVTTKNLATLADTTRLAASLGARHVHLEVPAPDSGAARDGAIPRWDLARPTVLAAIAAVSRRVATVQGVPFCVMREAAPLVAPMPHWALTRTRRFKAKHAQCTDCVGYVLCGGFYASEHEVAYGMMPVRDEGGMGS